MSANPVPEGKNENTLPHSSTSPESPLPTTTTSPEKWKSPLERLRLAATTTSGTTKHQDERLSDDIDIDEIDDDGSKSHPRLPRDVLMHHHHHQISSSKTADEGYDLNSMDRPPVYRREGPYSPRMPFHHDTEFFHQTSPQPGTPAFSTFSEDDLSKGVGMGQAGESRIELLAGGDQNQPEQQPSSREPVMMMKKANASRAVSFAPSSPNFHQDSFPSPIGDGGGGGRKSGGPGPGPGPASRSASWPSEPASWSFNCCGGVWQWHPSFTMHICFVFGIIFSVLHHLYYSFLEGKPAQDQTWILRYGSFLAYAAKAGFSSAVITAFKQRAWVTVRNRFMSISALDAMFAAGEDMMAMANLGFLKDAKGAYVLAAFAWTTPFVVILTANTLLVEPRRMTYNTTCPGVRTLNFSFEETNEWRNPTAIDGLFENPVSLWNTTKRADDSDPDWFDYYTGPSSGFQQTITLGAFLEEVVARKGAAAEICGVGWNCTFMINFTAPGYQCTELASGVDTVPKNLTQESGEAVPPFGTDLLLPRGNYSYYAYTTAGEYSQTQFKKASVGGIPLIEPPYPKHFAALRTEPVIWVGYTVLNYPNQTQPSRNESGWDDAFTPKIFACEHRETAYVANFSYIDGTQFANVTSREYGLPIINTTFLPGIDANDGTDDNVTAIPEENYILPINNNTAQYRRVSAYHSFGRMLRHFMNGTVTVEGTLVQPIENTQAIQTKLLDQRSNYFPYPDLMDRVSRLYDDMILSVFSNPQFVEVVWAAKPDEQTGNLIAGGLKDGENASDYMYACTRFRTENVWSYHVRDLWIVYGTYAFFTLICIAAGAFAIHENGGVTRNTQFSSVVAATRGPALEKIAWQGPLQDRGDVPAEVKRLRLGYGVMSDMNTGRLSTQMPSPDSPSFANSSHPLRRSTTYNSGFVSEMRCGFGMKGDVDQRHREGSLFHR